MNKRITGLVLVGIALSTCETTSASASPNMRSLPEFQAHMQCLRYRAGEDANANASPLELGIR